nr:putative phosphothreonine lyase domain-containg protein [Flavivirga aquatica]
MKKEHPRKYNRLKRGKWLFFVNINELDKIWVIIKEATEKGNLGTGAKSATAKSNPNETSKNEKVICVYTYNWLDVDDVMRVEKELRLIGVTSTMFYKTDDDTVNTKYKKSGNKGISKYISHGVNYENIKISLNSLYRVGSNTLKILENLDITNIDNLLNFDTSVKLKNVGISSESILNLKTFALSQMENKIYKKKLLEIPKGNLIYYDIETDLNSSIKEKKVWSIALLFNREYKVFYAENWNEERRILKEFILYLRKISNPILMSYSGNRFDENVVYNSLERYNLNPSYFKNLIHLDLCNLLKASYVFPTKGYGLKEVSSYLGYDFKSKYSSGMFVAGQYISCQRTGDNLPEDIFKYIKDDVYSMKHIVKELNKKRSDVIDLNN